MSFQGLNIPDLIPWNVGITVRRQCPSLNIMYSPFCLEESRRDVRVRDRSYRMHPRTWIRAYGLCKAVSKRLAVCLACTVTTWGFIRASMRHVRSDEINARHFPNPCSWVELAESMARERMKGQNGRLNLLRPSMRECWVHPRQCGGVSSSSPFQCTGSWYYLRVHSTGTQSAIAHIICEGDRPRLTNSKLPFDGLNRAARANDNRRFWDLGTLIHCRARDVMDFGKGRNRALRG
jgi:hypothetical protein